MNYLPIVIILLNCSVWPNEKGILMVGELVPDVFDSVSIKPWIG